LMLLYVHDLETGEGNTDNFEIRKVNKWALFF
jgi:hypothetical protein